jgi:hypothetical protein
MTQYDWEIVISFFVKIEKMSKPPIRLDLIGPNGLSYPNMFLVGYPISHNIGGLYHELLVQHHPHDEPLGFGFVTLAHD